MRKWIVFVAPFLVSTFFVCVAALWVDGELYGPSRDWGLWCWLLGALTVIFVDQFDLQPKVEVKDA
jgi:hypothetical protein